MQIPDGNLFLPIALHQRLKRARIALVQIVIVVVSRAVVGPVAKIFQDGIGVVGRPFGAVQIQQGASPQIPCLVDPLAKGQQRLLREAGGQISQLRIKTAGHLLAAIAHHAGLHEMGRRRNQERVRLIVEQQPGRRNLVGGKMGRRKFMMTKTKDMERLRQCGESGKSGRRRFRGGATGLRKERDSFLLVEANLAAQRLPGVPPFKGDLGKITDAVAAHVGCDVVQRDAETAAKCPGRIFSRDTIIAVFTIHLHRHPAGRSRGNDCFTRDADQWEGQQDRRNKGLKDLLWNKEGENGSSHLRISEWPSAKASAPLPPWLLAG